MSGIIDAHVHLYPQEANADPVAWARQHGETHWAILCTRQRKNGQWVQGFPSVDELLREMDAAGVERSILLGWYWQWPETCLQQNAFYADCIRRHPARLSAFATLHPAAGREATLRLVREAKEQGFLGLGELSPHSQGYDISDSVFIEAMELAGELRLAVNLHVTEMQTGAYPGRVETPLRDFVWLAHSTPHTNYILAHWGAGLPLVEEEARELYNLFYDTAATPLTYADGEIWRLFREAGMMERVLFGSDHPLNVYPGKTTQADMRLFLEEARARGGDPSLLSRCTRRLLHLQS